MHDATVAIARCADYDQVESAVDEVLTLLGGLKRFIRAGQSVLIKPNLLKAASVESAVNTHPAVLRAIVQRVQDLGADPFIGDSPAFGTAPKAAQRSGIAEVAEECGVPVIELDEPVSIRDPSIRSVKRLKISRHVLEADAIINVPKLKVHQQMQLTGAIKNLFGCVPGKRKARLHLTHGQDRVRFAEMILETISFIRPTLTLTDAVIAMERMGPRNGDPYPLGLITAGVDVVALDCVHWAILGQDPEMLDFLKAARKLKMGETRLDRIPIAGIPLGDVQVQDFQMSRQIPVTFSPFRIVKSTIKHLWAKRIA